MTARCVSMLAQLGETPRQARPWRAASSICSGRRLEDGSWYGRWGLNYIYGTWSSLCALNACGIDHSSPEIRKAVNWLMSIQNPDGGWGEDGTSYKLDYRGHEPATSTSSQTAWALLGLMACGEVAIRPLRAACNIWRRRRPSLASGMKSDLRRPVFRGSSICAITDTGNSFRSGRSRAIAI